MRRNRDRRGLRCPAFRSQRKLQTSRSVAACEVGSWPVQGSNSPPASAYTQRLQHRSERLAVASRRLQRNGRPLLKQHSTQGNAARSSLTHPSQFRNATPYASVLSLKLSTYFVIPTGAQRSGEPALRGCDFFNPPSEVLIGFPVRCEV